MILNTAQFKYFQTAICFILLSVAVSVFAKDKNNQIKTLFSPVDGYRSTAISQSQTNKSSPNSSVTLDFSNKIAESWDEKDQPSNMIVECLNGDVITGVEYTNVTIETVGNSFFSEAVIYFSDSNVANNGLNFAIGSRNENSGIQTFSSIGIVDITDTGNLDVISLSDKKFIIQFYEQVDDGQETIDARFTNGSLKIWGVNLTPTENCPFIATTNSGGSDLEISYSLASTSPIQVGDTLVFDIVVTNLGIDIATAVAIQNTLSPNLEFSQFNCDDGTSVSSPDSIASVDVNNIAASGTLACSLEAVVVSVGSLEIGASVTTTFDFDLSNNSIAIVFGGAFAIVPINNTFMLILLALGLLLLARKFNKT